MTMTKRTLAPIGMILGIALLISLLVALPAFASDVIVSYAGQAEATQQSREAALETMGIQEVEEIRQRIGIGSGVAIPRRVDVVWVGIHNGRFEADVLFVGDHITTGANLTNLWTGSNLRGFEVARRTVQAGMIQTHPFLSPTPYFGQLVTFDLGPAIRGDFRLTANMTFIDGNIRTMERRVYFWW